MARQRPPRSTEPDVYSLKQPQDQKQQTDFVLDYRYVLFNGQLSAGTYEKDHLHTNDICT